MEVFFHTLINILSQKSLPKKKMWLTFNKWSCSTGCPNAHSKTGSEEASPPSCGPVSMGEEDTPSPPTSHILPRMKTEEMKEETRKLSNREKRSVPNTRSCAGELTHSK